MLILHRVLVLFRVNLGVKLDLQIQVSFHFFMSFLKNEIVQGTNNAIKNEIKALDIAFNGV